MFQGFEAKSRPQDGPPRLAALRAQMASQGLDGFLVPRADQHQGEYVAPRDERLAWLTGFTGSAGFAVVLKDVAGVFVDGRYRVQVKDQTADVFTPVNWPETKLGDWLADQLPAGGIVGLDPWLHTKGEIETLETRLEKTGITLREVENPIDAIWQDQPDRPAAPAMHYPKELAGKGDETKRAEIAKVLADAGQTAVVLTLPDSICWLLNIRGADIPRIPIVQAFAILFADGRMQLFSEPSKFADLGPDPAIELAPWDAFPEALKALQGPVRVDKASAPLSVSRILDAAGVEIAYAEDPCILPKACKTAAELAATREAHLRDGAAMVEFLCWLDAQDPEDLTEIDVVTALEGFRAATGCLRDLAFDTICGTGPNGAIVHYRVTEETNRKVAAGDLLLVDSGAQYVDGTTDVTRTIAMGDPPSAAVAAYTRVLQGMIAISRARWPRGLSGRDLDALARAPLWMAGQDYDHGTGHGVGVFLSVHEGPQRLSRVSETALAPGMILSNEPGYYREGAFGIRIENLVVVTEAERLPGGDDQRRMHGFETLTYVPIDTRLVDPALLSTAERDWLNAYHADVAARIGPRVSDRAGDWLIRATRAI